jgi:hypothetical protein
LAETGPRAAPEACRAVARLVRGDTRMIVLLRN